ncbi:DUF2721 domain-containing protein [Marilutibacter spongiae]|uniref:DUF2721 domain-containing protein n=1 Tax=Marilutibacter spongiae TaxID=2025720 RepID=A0A7W3Y5H3_9GAMM|nr:DUF2721 domain-containing protein [Lysobacter spongiae]MBB1060463.1 DUF2721 domain-containing protein [Lysobacter spongiae]
MLQDAAAHYTILTAMLAPAFFLTATASLLMSANARLARVIDRARTLLQELESASDEQELRRIESQIAIQRRRSRITLYGGQLLYIAVSCFVGTSLTVAADAFLGYRFVSAPTALAALGVTMLLAASVLLAYESSLAVRVINDEMDHGHARATARRTRGR